MLGATIILPLPCHLGGSDLIGLARPDLGQELFRLHLLSQTFVEQGRGFRHVQCAAHA
jgi:hypothetical protein